MVDTKIESELLLSKWRTYYKAYLVFLIISTICFSYYCFEKDLKELLLYTLFLSIGIILGFRARKGKNFGYNKNFNDFSTMFSAFMAFGAVIHIVGYFYHKYFCHEPSKVCDATLLAGIAVPVDLFCCILTLLGYFIHKRVENLYLLKNENAEPLINMS